MEENIMTNENVMETAEEIVTANSGNWLKSVGIGAGIALVGLAAYKCGKLLKAKIEARKENQADDTVETDEDSNVIVLEEQE